MRPLLVYYSRTGTTRSVVDELEKRMTADTFEIREDSSRKGMFGWLRACRDAFKKRLAPINKPHNVPSRYPVVVLAMPVWVGTIPPAMRSYIKDNLTGVKRVAFLTTQGGKGQQAIFAELEELTGKKPLAVAQFLRKDVRKRNSRFETTMDRFIKHLDL